MNPGDIYDEQALERGFNSLWNTAYFDDVRFEREETAKGNYILHIYVTEKPTIREINYKGLNAVSQSDVLDRYKKDKVALSIESPYDPTKVKKAEVELRALLAEHGHQFATVNTEVRRIPPAAVGITFVVKEGPKVKVGKIQFQGNEKLPSRELQGAMKNLHPIGIPHSIILEDLFAKTYDASKLQEDAERVRAEYQSKGYFKAIIEDPKTRIVDTGSSKIPIPPFGHGNGKRVDITVPVEEGERYRLGSISFTNNKAIPNAKALRALFKMKDGDIFDASQVRKGLEELRKAYADNGYIDYVPHPDTTIDEDKKQVNLIVDLDEGRQYLVRRIEFVGNSTTRDKVVRRELALEEGQIYNGRLWELSLLRLNQLGYFEKLDPADSTDTKKNTQDGTVDLTLKLKEKGKNSIGLTGGVSGLSGTFIGLNYTTNNFLGLGETLSLTANIGALQQSIVFGFTEPYLFDRPLQAGFQVFTTKYEYNYAKNLQISANQKLNISQNQLQYLQDYSNSRKGFSLNASYPLKRSFKRLGIQYQLEDSSIRTYSQASLQYFESVNFDGASGPNSLNGILTSEITPNFSFNNLNYAPRPTKGKSIFVSTEVAGIGGNVKMIRPTFEYKQFIPVNKGRNTVGYRVQSSFVTGYGGLLAPPYQRFYAGGENDIRGFDIRSVTPYAFITNEAFAPLLNPDGTAVPKDPTNPRAGSVSIPVPVQRVIFAGGDSSVIGNLEYRIPIAGPVAVALFDDFGMNFAARSSQLQLSNFNLQQLSATSFGCPTIDPVSLTCQGGSNFSFPSKLQIISGTNYTPRMSTGGELQVILPVVNAPFRIYYAYNPLRLNELVANKSLLNRSMFPAGGAGDYSYLQAVQTYGSNYVLHEPRKTFRFTVATTF